MANALKAIPRTPLRMVTIQLKEWKKRPLECTLQHEVEKDCYCRLNLTTTSNKPCRCSQKQGRDGQGVVCDREYKRVGSRVSRFAAQLIIDTRGGYRIHLPPMVPGVSFARSLIPSLTTCLHPSGTNKNDIHPYRRPKTTWHVPLSASPHKMT